MMRNRLRYISYFIRLKTPHLSTNIYRHLILLRNLLLLHCLVGFVVLFGELLIPQKLGIHLTNYEGNQYSDKNKGKEVEKECRKKLLRRLGW